MMIDAWIVINTVALDALVAANDPIATHGVRGHWADISPNEVLNVLLDAAALTTFVTANTADITAVYSWVQGNGLDNQSAYPTDPTGVLSLMANNELHDVDGNLISSTPATLEDPNWGHVFLGQPTRVFAGEFSNEFSEEFF